MTVRIAVIGDVHGNAVALAAALRATERSDTRVFLGDLLTYGPDIDAILDQVEGVLESRDAILLRGNHDDLYERMGDNEANIRELPGWIQESIQFVAARLDVARFRRLPWCDEYGLHSILFAHANPFGRRDWTYINSSDEHSAVADALCQRGFAVGVFGHTHRARFYDRSSDGYRVQRPPAILRADWSQLHQHPWVLNSGSVGQPRDADPASYVLWLTVYGHGCSARFEEIHYDRARHLEDLRRAALTEETRRRLLEFHLPSVKRKGLL